MDRKRPNAVVALPILGDRTSSCWGHEFLMNWCSVDMVSDLYPSCGDETNSCCGREFLVNWCSVDMMSIISSNVANTSIEFALTLSSSLRNTRLL